jgi:bifunctional DNA-binding transcriptional regulator/antitoxin component of YhaV-PrlF toxin-antitoxin module
VPLVKVKTKYQVTLPTALREQVGVSVGDVLEAKVERGKITFTPKSIIDRDLAESLEDFKNGRTYGPFNSAEEMIRSLHQHASKARTRKTSKARG